MAQYKYNTECGPNAIDYYNDYTRRYDGADYRSHWIEGTGSITCCTANGYSRDIEVYSIQSGITELCDGCFSHSSISSVSLPSTLLTIGSNCFKNSKITTINLPEGLKKIGHDNEVNPESWTQLKGSNETNF